MFSTTAHNLKNEFLFGAATSAYQIEGAWNTDGKGESIWDNLAHFRPELMQNGNGDIACDHYHRYKSDIRLMREMGLDAYRFSIAWTRIFPDGYGKVNSKGLDFYHRLMDELLENGIQPFPTLYHWDLPQHLESRFGGWLSRDVCNYFADYAHLMVHEFGDKAEKWVTINEPQVVAIGYGTPMGSPAHNNPREGMQVQHNILLAHGLAVQAMRSARSNIKAGIVINATPLEPLNEQARTLCEEGWSHGCAWFFDAVLKGRYPTLALEYCEKNGLLPIIKPGDFSIIGQHLDFLGLNYYMRFVFSADGRIIELPDREYSDMEGWEVSPESFAGLLNHLHNEYKLPPLYITENGLCHETVISENKQIHDQKRISYLQRHLMEVNKARDAGMDIRGYFAWSLLDNLEWNNGYQKQFGLVAVDRETQERIWKDSAYWYQQLIKDCRS